MDTENTSDVIVNETETVAETQTPVQEPRKLLLGKRVVRHFGVRTSIQAGGGSTRMRCF